jgi:hypothetical protein
MKSLIANALKRKKKRFRCSSFKLKKWRQSELWPEELPMISATVFRPFPAMLIDEV